MIDTRTKSKLNDDFKHKVERSIKSSDECKGSNYGQIVEIVKKRENRFPSHDLYVQVEKVNALVLSSPYTLNATPRLPNLIGQ